MWTPGKMWKHRTQYRSLLEGKNCEYFTSTTLRKQGRLISKLNNWWTVIEGIRIWKARTNYSWPAVTDIWAHRKLTKALITLRRYKSHKIG